VVATGVVVALLVVAVTVGRVSAAGRAAAHTTTLDVLRADGIAGVHFGASPAALRRALEALVGQRGGSYSRGGSCGLDHEITWRDGRTTSGEPELIAYFRRSAFAGYQFGDPQLVGAPHRPPGGWTLATIQGLRLGDTLAHGRRVYGRAFAISTAQGGSWSVRVAGGRLVGYAWGRPKYGDVSWQSVVATIDGGDVGCAALTP
jgi:hypothetical protein